MNRVVEFLDVSYDDAMAQLLIEEVQQEYVVRYGGPDETPVIPGEFASPGGAFLVAVADGEPAGCVALRRLLPADVPTAELKRMYVRASHRRNGLGARLLTAAEERARELGYRRLVLETGLAQPEAMALYARAGYGPIDNFGYHRCSPTSRSYGKDL